MDEDERVNPLCWKNLRRTKQKTNSTSLTFVGSFQCIDIPHGKDGTNQSKYKKTFETIHQAILEKTAISIGKLHTHTLSWQTVQLHSNFSFIQQWSGIYPVEDNGCEESEGTFPPLDFTEYALDFTMLRKSWEGHMDFTCFILNNTQYNLGRYTAFLWAIGNQVGPISDSDRSQSDVKTLFYSHFIRYSNRTFLQHKIFIIERRFIRSWVYRILILQTYPQKYLIRNFLG